MDLLKACPGLISPTEICLLFPWFNLIVTVTLVIVLTVEKFIQGLVIVVSSNEKAPGFVDYKLVHLNNLHVLEWPGPPGPVRTSLHQWHPR